MKSKTYDFSSVHADLPEALAKKIIDWGNEHIPEKDISLDEDGGGGREIETHVTVLYGLHSPHSEQVRKALLTQKPFTIELGKVSIFASNPKFDVVKIDVKSPELFDLNKKLRNDCEYTNGYSEYKPHVTIAYVKKGKGWKCNLSDDFNDCLFEVSEVVFSSKTGKREKIKLL